MAASTRPQLASAPHMAAGSGMIHPNMGTMLCFITTDCAITQDVLQDALHEIVPRTPPPP